MSSSSDPPCWTTCRGGLVQSPGSVSSTSQVLIGGAQKEHRAVEVLNVTLLVGKEPELVHLGSPLHTAWALEPNSSTFISLALPMVISSGLLWTGFLRASSAAKCWSSRR